MNHLQKQLLSIPLFVFATLGCSGAHTGRQHQFEQYLDAGVPVAVNRGGPKFEGELFRYEEVVTLQQDPRVPESFIYKSLSFIPTEKGFFMDGEGRYYVGDSGGARIAVFDEEGRFVRSIGRRGQGPGEFMLNELYELTDGILKSHDYNLHRTTYYRTDGGLVDVVRSRSRYIHDGELFVNLAGPSHYDENGHLWMGAGFVAMTAGTDTFGHAETGRVRILYEFPTPGHGKGGKSRPPVPFVERPFARYVSDGSVLLTDGVEPVLWWYRLDGSIRKRIELGLPWRPTTEEDRRRFYLDLDEQIAAADENQKVYLGWMRDAVTFNEYRTLWSHISIDDEGYIWLEGYEAEFERRDRGGGFTYYVLSPEGEFLGTTRAPAAGRIMRGLLLGEVTEPGTDKLDYTVWRLLPQAEGFVYP